MHRELARWKAEGGDGAETNGQTGCSPRQTTLPDQEIPLTTAPRKSLGEKPKDPIGRRFPGLGLIALLAAAVLLASGAGWLALRGGGGPTVRLLIEADLSQLPTGTTPNNAMQQIERILVARAHEFGASGTDVSVESGTRLSITLRNIDLDVARDLFLRSGYLEARQPVLDDNGAVSCRTADGATFTSQPESIIYRAVPSSVTRLPACMDNAGRQGEISWEPANASGKPGDGPVLNGTFMEPGGAAVLSVDRPVLVIQFNIEGATLLNQITERLLDLPLGIFVDGKLIFGPTVREPIIEGRLDIYGLSLHDARILAAQLNAGPLPAPMREVASE